MKKYSIFLLASLALGFSACEDKSDLGIEQINPQEPIINADGLTLAAASTLSSGVNLETNTAAMIPVVSIQDMVDFPEGSNISIDMQLSSDANYSNVKTLAVTDGSVSADEWEQACTSFYGLDPTKKDMYVRFAAYIEEGVELARLGGDNYWYLDNTVVSVVPIDAKLDVESVYYIVSGNNKVELSHSDAHVYNDPSFSLVFEVNADQLPYEWMIAPVSAVDNANSSNCYGVSETGSAEDLSGNLVLGGQKGVINEAGNYSLSVNMLDKTYSITKIVAPQVDYLYTPGEANGWTCADTNMLLFNNGDQTFRGYVYVNKEFKLSADTDWAQNWGLDGGVMTKDGSNIGVDPSGLYYVNADFNNMTIGLTHITRIGVIGDFNDWGSDIALTPNEDYSIWSGEVDFTTDGGWKFRMNDGWDLDLGGSHDNLTKGGANMDQAAGVYTVTLDLSKIPYSCTVVAK